MLPDRSQICERETPPWQAGGHDHRIFSHTPLEDLRALEPAAPASLR
ncbi:MAG: hypothetical protein HY784_04510 [Chloroflexi bacterium]|nr:hypothetical protein [Chloroflexota bacterium]